MNKSVRNTLLNTLKLLLVLITAFSIVACGDKKQENNNDIEITTSAGTHKPDWANDATTFRVSVTKADDGSSETTVEVYEGSVDSTVNGEQITVNEGETITIDDNGVKEGSIDIESLPKETKEKLEEFTN